MGRIRSVHPDQWTDAAFCACSPLARLLAIAMRNEADDQGVLPWDSRTFRLRLLPGDPDADMDALLDELVREDLIQPFEIDGKRYAVIRNFARFQSPKKPTYRHPLPNQLRTYAGFEAQEAGSSGEQSGGGSEPVRNQGSTDSPRRGEERRGVGVGEEEGSSLRSDPTRARAREDPQPSTTKRRRSPAGRRALDKAIAAVGGVPPAVEAAAEEWRAYRAKAKHRAWTPETWAKNLHAARGDPASFAAAVEASIGSGYAGLFRADGSGQFTAPRRPSNGRAAPDRTQGIREFRERLRRQRETADPQRQHTIIDVEARRDA